MGISQTWPSQSAVLKMSPVLPARSSMHLVQARHSPALWRSAATLIPFPLENGHLIYTKAH